jgi:small subunit ribosomal protein S16
MPVMVVLLSVLVFFNPVAKGAAEAVRLDADRYNYWVSQGAQPSERVAQIAKTALLLKR